MMSDDENEQTEMVILCNIFSNNAIFLNIIQTLSRQLISLQIEYDALSNKYDASLQDIQINRMENKDLQQQVCMHVTKIILIHI